MNKSENNAELSYVYSLLSNIDVSAKVEQKGGFDYLSWAHAWDMLKRNYPTAQRTVYESVDSDGRVLCYFTDGNTAYVKVGITICDHEHVDFLPIMDYRNNSLSLEKITTFDIIATIQRSTAKAIAMHGLGLCLWTGEDVSSTTEEPKKSAGTEKKYTIYTLDIGDENWEKVLRYVSENKEMGLAKIVNQLKRKYTIKTEVKKEIGKIIKKK